MRAEGRSSQARHRHGRKTPSREVHGSGHPSFGLASAKTRFCDLGPHLWILTSSSVHDSGGPNSGSRCLDCYPQCETYFYQHAYTRQKQQLHQTVLTACSAFWYFLSYSLLFHCFKNASLDLLNGFHNPLIGHALGFEKEHPTL